MSYQDNPGNYACGKVLGTRTDQYTCLPLVVEDHTLKLLVAAMVCDVNRVTIVREIPLIRDSVHLVMELCIIIRVGGGWVTNSDSKNIRLILR